KAYKQTFTVIENGEDLSNVAVSQQVPHHLLQKYLEAIDISAQARSRKTHDSICDIRFSQICF
ncbi:MAG: hypothetical protein OSB19_17715, partial [Opitutaceae bacterium]|nr:hypothetical protein [Opitutaceae bacterium]